MNSTLNADPQECKRKARCKISLLLPAPWPITLLYGFLLNVANVDQDPYQVHLFFWFFILPAEMTRVLTKWPSVFCWDFRRSWKVLRMEQCSVWEDRWTSSYSRPWIPKIWANSFLDGNLGCDLEGSSTFLEETYFYAANVITVWVGISQLKLRAGTTMRLILISVWRMFWGFFFSNLLPRKYFLSTYLHHTAQGMNQGFDVPCDLQGLCLGILGVL